MYYLTEFLDTISLTRAERLYYEKHFRKDKSQKSFEEWSKLTGLQNKKTS